MSYAKVVEITEDKNLQARMERGVFNKKGRSVHRGSGEDQGSRSSGCTPGKRAVLG